MHFNDVPWDVEARLRDTLHGSLLARAMQNQQGPRRIDFNCLPLHSRLTG
jgi:hypothetical protein